MAFSIPYKNVTPIPETDPAAIPSLWNDRYDQIDANFKRVCEYSGVGLCSTAAGTAAKSVSVSNFELLKYSTVKIIFSVGNTASSPTLNVNGTGAFPIKYRGQAVAASVLGKNRMHEFCYDGASWVIVGDLDPVVGGDMTVSGNISAADPTASNHVTTKQYVDAGDEYGISVYGAFSQFATDCGV